MKCGPNLQKYMLKNEIPEEDYFESASEDPLTDADEDDAPGAAKAVDDDPIKGYKMRKRKAGE